MRTLSDFHAMCEPFSLRLPWSTAVRLAGCDAQGCPKNCRSSAARNRAGSGETQSRRGKKNFNGRNDGEAPSADQASRLESEEKTATSDTPKPATPPAHRIDTSEAVFQKAKTGIAASIDDPASARSTT